MDSTSWEETLRKRYCEKPYYVLPYDGEPEDADLYEWEYIATEEYLCGYFTMRIYYNSKTRRVTDFECDRYDEECYGGRPLMDDGNVTRIQQKTFTEFFKSWTTQNAAKAGSVPDDDQIEIPNTPFTGADLEYEHLVTAILAEDIPAVQQYLFAASYPYKPEYQGRLYLPLYAAIKVNNVDICRALVDSGVDPDPFFVTPEGEYDHLVVCALRMGSITSAEYLMSTEKIGNLSNLQNAFFKQLVRKSPYMVDEFIHFFELGYFKSMDLIEVPIFDWIDTLNDDQIKRILYCKIHYFHNAAFNTYYDLIDHIMKKRADAISETIVSIAATHMDTQLALIEHFAKTRDFDGYCSILSSSTCNLFPAETFHKLYKRGKKWSAKLIEHGFDINRENGILLKRAYSHRCDSEIAGLLSLGADPSILTANGDTWDSIGWGLKAQIEKYYNKHPKLRKSF